MEHANEDLTACLPSEILYDIIDCVPADERDPCAHVSRRWRSVAFDNHSACWFRSRCEKHIYLDGQRGPASVALGLAQLKCRAAHASTASVHIIFVRTPTSDAEEVLRALPHALRRIDSLSLAVISSTRPSPTQVLDALAYPAQHLQSLALAFSDPPKLVCLRRDLFAQECPNLVRLSLSGIYIPSEPLVQLRNLSRVRLDQSDLPFDLVDEDHMQDCQPGLTRNASSKLFPEEVFVNAPNLRELVLERSPCASGILSAPQQSTTTGLSGLEELGIHSNSLLTIIDLACLASVRNIVADLTVQLRVRPTQHPRPRVPHVVESFLSHLPGRLGVLVTGYFGSGPVSVSIVDKDNVLRRQFHLSPPSMPQALPPFDPVLPRITFLGISTSVLDQAWPTFSELNSLEKFRLLVDRDHREENVYLPPIRREPLACPALRTFHVVGHLPWSSTMSADELCSFARSLFTEETLSSAVLEVANEITLRGWTAAHHAVFAPPVPRSPDERMAALAAQANVPYWAIF